MSWSTQGQILNFHGENCRISAAPLGGQPLKPEVSRPPGDVWVVTNMYVKDEFRGVGEGKALLLEVAKKLTSDVGDVWVGLLGDTQRGRKSSSQEARDAWESFCTFHSLERSGGLAFFAASKWE